MSTEQKPILCLDFDGVIHSYSSGWQGAACVTDPPVDGSLEFLSNAILRFKVAIFSSRSKSPNWRTLELSPFVPRRLP